MKQAAYGLLTIILAAGCSPAPDAATAAGATDAQDGFYGALPPDLAALIAEGAARHWSQCEDVWVTRNSGRDGQGHPHAYIMAGVMQLHHDGDFQAGSGDGPIRIRVSSAMHRVYQSADMPRRQPARGPGWSEWVALTAPELPVWSARRNGDNWEVTFRPDADEADHDRYSAQYLAPACDSVPAG